MCIDFSLLSVPLSLPSGLFLDLYIDRFGRMIKIG